VLAESSAASVPAWVIAGDVVRSEIPAGARALSLVERSGSSARAHASAAALLAEAAAELAAR